ncbi:hypothetical protein BDM02DRAFT_3187864 [Thelephora ganbajun]|uniref:Uncharacterized protein n=1 Tax=Thelephora ganbajun TaxID=370292 RepID=A0ACB6ZD34_THEGA|nr:hypothetical protein BDM02DRAFT_3187864 [Thelephora ganbajun]
MKLLLKHPECNMKVVAVNGKIVKFVDEGTESRTINGVDSGLVEFKTAVQSLNIQIESIQNRIKERRRRPLRWNGTVRGSLGYLRARKQLEGILIKRSKIMKLYGSSAIGETMDVLHSVTEDAKDADLTIRRAGEAERATIADDDEIEGELRALTKDAKDDKRMAEEQWKN